MCWFHFFHSQSGANIRALSRLSTEVTYKLVFTLCIRRKIYTISVSFMLFICEISGQSASHTCWCQSWTHITEAADTVVPILSVWRVHPCLRSSVEVQPLNIWRTFASQWDKLVVSGSIHLPGCHMNVWHSVCCPGHWNTSEAKWVQRAPNEQSSHT